METPNRRVEEQKVRGMAETLIDSLERSLSWADSHVKQDQIKTFMVKSLQGKRATVRKILESAKRPIAMGVFGASQCGKSYLVSELIKGDKKALNVYLNAADKEPQIRDYLEEINPAGGRESTAIVTRFSKQPYHEIKGSSASVRLLSRVDLIKIFLNGFLFECQSDFTPSVEELQKLRYSLRGIPRKGDSEVILTEEDIWDLQDYVKRHFKNQFLKMLEDINFWGILNDEVRFLPFDYQILFLEWLWGKFSKLTELFKFLLKALGNNGNEIVGLYQDALLPRDKSIIDVQRLATLSKPGNRKCPIGLADGRMIEMDSAVLCALACELILKVPSDGSVSILDQMDVLDFPGARARAQVFDNTKLGSDPLALTEVFLRGKVAYLFDRYSDDRDITGLVLCQEGGPQEAKSLPYMINKWVEWSQGPDAKSRQNLTPLLFHVFTKFDVDLVRKKGEDPQGRWESRLKSNFEEFFGRAGDWITKWDEASAFRNCFWVRNPNVQQTVFGRDKAGVEFIRDESQLAEIKGQYLGNDLVRRHFKDPEEAWNRAASPGQSGIEFLVERLKKDVEPNAKTKQLEANLRRIFADMKTLLEPYYAGDDITRGRALAEERAKKRLAALMKVMSTRYSLPYILDRDYLAISEKTVAMIYDSIVNPMESDSGKSDNENASITSAPVFSEDIFGIEGIAVEEKPEKKAPIPVCKNDLFAKAVLDRWHEQLIRLSKDNDLQNKTGLDSEWFADVAQEIMKGALRNGIFRKISESSQKRVSSPNAMKFMRMQASFAAGVINKFIIELGQTRKETAIPTAAPRITLSAKAYPGLAIYQHWSSSLMQLFKDNVAEADKADEESNAILKGIFASALT